MSKHEEMARERKALVKPADKHDWEAVSVGEYDTTYQCRRCGKLHMESADNPLTERPNLGCAIDAAELLTCQCANSNVRIMPAERPNTVPWHYWVECSCGNRGSIESTKECAIQQWNAQRRNDKHEKMALEMVRRWTGKPINVVQDVVNALSRIEQETEARVLEKVWNEIDAAIKPGILPGNGMDKTAERNGLILATNIVSSLSTKNLPTSPKSVEGHVSVPREEATYEQMQAGSAAVQGAVGLRTLTRNEAAAVYRAMIQAAPDTDVSTEGGLINPAAPNDGAEVK